MSLDGNKQIQKLKGRITRSNSLPSICSPAINQLRGKYFNKYFVVNLIIDFIINRLAMPMFVIAVTIMHSSGVNAE